MAEYLEDTRTTLDEVCREYDGDCKDCPAYEFCPSGGQMKKRIITLIKLVVIVVIVGISFAIGLGIGTKGNKPKKPTTYHNECPMCHSNVKLMVRQYTCGNDYMIECLNDDCGMHTGYFEDKEELVEKWNKMFKTLKERKGE